MAANVMGVGIHKVKIKDAEKAVQAMTNDDIRSLVKQGVIVKKRVRGVSRVRARKIAVQKKKGRRRGPGKVKSSLKARVGKKTVWMRKVRALRRELRSNRANLEPGLYRKLYNMTKGGYFRSKAHLRNYIEERTKKAK
jgi:large subunit ribosomal protein L19e